MSLRHGKKSGSSKLLVNVNFPNNNSKLMNKIFLYPPCYSGLRSALVQIINVFQGSSS